MDMPDMGRRPWRIHQRVDSSTAWFVLQWISVMTTVLLVLALGAFLLYVVSRGVPKSSSRRARVSGMSPKMKVVLALTMLVDYSCTDQYQPNIPAMAKFFMVSPTEMGFTIQIHLLFCALGMTVVGPLSDRIGRRPVILACQLMQAISTVTCMCASSIGWFMAGRAIQGLAASVYVAILASMRDCFDDAASRQRAMGAMMSVMLIGPIFAPAVGGYLASDFGWRCPFGLLAIFAVALACISYHVIHETAPAHEEASNLAPASAVVA
ncbi:mdtL [Symbiodinium necroappetens]|uniref:MdtL protein n=1 Tax=Symbiodinium necroappetens TaxID=1628268 RepID=A0A813AAC7_9DINO|nr:mdtL [Symbiodinium necroappetens]